MDQSLPTELVLAVLAYLSPRELLSCRQVCRRLRDLCLHPVLWGSVQLSDRRDGNLVRAALRLAPCLKELELATGLKQSAEEIATSRCVISRLELRVKSEVSVAWACLIVSKSSSLGGLTSIRLCLSHDVTNDDANVIYKTVHGVDVLRELDIETSSDTSKLSFWCGQEKTSSLTELSYDTDYFDSFILNLLRTHSSTLEVVRLLVGKELELPLALLGALPKLKSFSCIGTYDLGDLKTLAPLSSVMLDDCDKATPGTEEFLRQATHLRTVELYSELGVPLAPILALSESPSALILENLTLLGVSNLLGALTTLLPHFPALRTLRLDAAPSDHFLRAVNQASLPLLTELTVKMPAHEKCLHEWLHDPAVHDLLARNTSLHLRVDGATTPPHDCNCRWCRWGCHSELKESASVLSSAFASHRRILGCPSDCLKWQCAHV